MNLVNESEFILKLKAHRERIISEMKSSSELANTLVESKASVL